MKRLKYQLIIPCGLVLLVLVNACSKSFLNKPPLGTLSPAIVANKNGVEGILIGAYSLLDGNGGNGGGWGAAGSNWVYGSVCSDDALKGSTPSDQGDIAPLEVWNATATNSYPAGKWALCYDGIQRSNDVLRTLPLTTDVSAADALQMTAEARFLRGHYHFELKRVFYNVPFVGTNITIDSNNYNVPNIDASGAYVNIWPQIEQDLAFAAANLPEQLPAAGRVNKWAATAELAKVYMTEGNYTAALPLLNSLITSGKCANGKTYTLVNYQDNFNPATQRAGGGGETVFAVQNSVNDGSAGDDNGNGNYGDLLNYPYGNNPAGVCCGFFNPSQDLMNAYKVDATGLPYLDGSWTTVGGNVSNGYAGNLDPRIDWVAGRPGIPYLDWGNSTTAWVRDVPNDGPFVPKKTSYALKQQGTYSSSESTFWGAVQLTANNTNLIRFADVLLWAAECEAAIGSLANATTLVNRVRTRAADPTGWVYAGGAVYNASNSKYSPQTTPADKYKVGTYATFPDQATAFKAIVMERRLEFAMEGSRFFDLQRWDRLTTPLIAGVTGAGSMATTLNAYAGREAALIPSYVGATFKKGFSEIFLIPQTQIDAVNAAGTILLKQNPQP
jgi:starch-binding outer membrane protein, SusD/RagB family